MLESHCVFQQGSWWPCQPVHKDRDAAAFRQTVGGTLSGSLMALALLPVQQFIVPWHLK